MPRQSLNGTRLYTVYIAQAFYLIRNNTHWYTYTDYTVLKIDQKEDL